MANRDTCFKRPQANSILSCVMKEMLKDSSCLTVLGVSVFNELEHIIQLGITEGCTDAVVEEVCIFFSKTVVFCFMCEQ